MTIVFGYDETITRRGSSLRHWRWVLNKALQAVLAPCQRKDLSER